MSQPTEPGWYWLFENDEWICVRVLRRSFYSDAPEDDAVLVTETIVPVECEPGPWGPKIPEPDKLREMLELDEDSKEWGRDHG